MPWEEEKAENWRELRDYDRAHNYDFDNPDFYKNRPPVIYKKRVVRKSPPLPMRIMKAVRRLFDEISRVGKKADHPRGSAD